MGHDFFHFIFLKDPFHIFECLYDTSPDQFQSKDHLKQAIIKKINIFRDDLAATCLYRTTDFKRGLIFKLI